MYSVKLGALTFALGLVVCAGLTSIEATSIRAVFADNQPMPGTNLPSIQKKITLRTADGRPVPGIVVQLTPADSLLGGPPAGTQSKQAETDATGTALFSDLSQWIWIVSFTGSSEGKAIQPMREQGKAPYGRTRSGGGFPVMLQRQEEDAPATPVVVNGTIQPEVQSSLFVLVLSPTQDQWVPSLDLSLPGEHPQPVAAVPTIQAAAQGTAAQALPSTSLASIAPLAPAATLAPTPSTAIAQTPNGTSVPVSAASSGGGHGSPSDPGSSIGWLYLLPLSVALFALFKAWQQRVASREPDPECPGEQRQQAEYMDEYTEQREERAA